MLTCFIYLFMSPSSIGRTADHSSVGSRTHVTGGGKRMKTKLSIIALLCCAQLWMGCSAKNPDESDVKGVSTAASLPGCGFASADDQFRTYRIQPGDQLDISFYLSPEFDQDLTVRPDGNISMPVVGNVRVQGLTPGQLEKNLDRQYSQELRDPKTTVRIDKSPGQVVYVEGQV